MTKAELVSKVASASGSTKKEVQAVLDGFGSVLAEIKQTGDKVAYPTIGTFSQKQTAARVGRNPSTGAAVSIPAKTKIAYKPAPELR